MIKKSIFTILVLILVLGIFDFTLAQTKELQIDFFYSAICPHCTTEKEFLATLKARYPELDIREYEIIYNKGNQGILKNFYDKYQVPERERGYVPVTFTPNKYFIGFSEEIGREIESCIKECLMIETPTPQKIKIPLLGEIDVSQMSLATLAITFGALDGLNPCAMWVLLFLIAILLNTRSRKRMWLIGGTFLLVSGVVYYLILSAWLNLFLVISYVNLTRILIGIFAFGFGIWQIKNFLTFKPGVCKVINEEGGFQTKLKNGLEKQAHKIANSPLTFGILVGVIILALGVNLVEFFCSAGLPAIFTRILAMNQPPKLTYHFYLLLYTFVFMLDDLIIFSLAMITLSKIGFTEKYNYWATFIGGLLILVLGILLIFKPEILMFA
ncbi:hypothetical protein AMJ50_01780 [Parcubacteria bacterium DG_74_3]|nr:MAG: hypothetical protein AMJ50_01780 [Parcubacteria bacterium DG_74_3]